MANRAIILAAGSGRRLESSGHIHPKCLIEFGGRTLLEYQIEALSRVGVTETVLVIGYLPTLIHHSLPHSEMRYQFVRNNEFATSNTLHSLALAAPFLDQDFFLLNADVLFDWRCLERLSQTPEESALACDFHPCGEEEVKARVENGCVRALGKALPREESLAEFIGLALFRGRGREKFVSALCRDQRDPGLRSEYFEYSLARVLDQANYLGVDISDLPNIEIDFPDDLLRARDVVYPQLGG